MARRRAWACVGLIVLGWVNLVIAATDTAELLDVAISRARVAQAEVRAQRVFAKQLSFLAHAFAEVARRRARQHPQVMAELTTIRGLAERAWKEVRELEARAQAAAAEVTRLQGQ